LITDRAGIERLACGCGSESQSVRAAH
jgi:hypothetical protein